MAQLPNANSLASFTALSVDEHQSTTHTNKNNNNSRNALVRGNTVTNGFTNSALIFGGSAFVGDANSINKDQHARPAQDDVMVMTVMIVMTVMNMIMMKTWMM